MKILAVDDEPMLLNLYPLLLKKHGIDSVIFDNVDDSVSYLRNEQVDGIISDIDMPVRTGIEFFNILKSEKIHSGLFIFVTAKWQPSYSYLLDEGVDKVFHKPVRHQELAEYLKKNFRS